VLKGEPAIGTASATRHVDLASLDRISAQGSVAPTDEGGLSIAIVLPRNGE